MNTSNKNSQVMDVGTKERMPCKAPSSQSPQESPSTHDQQAIELGLYRFVIRRIKPGRHIELIDGRWVADFATNCPLGVNERPEVRLAAVEAISDFGSVHSSIASARAGTWLAPEIAQRLAELKGPSSVARLYPTTLSANQAVSTGVVNADVHIVIDPRVHATVMAAIGKPQNMHVCKNSVRLANEYAASSSRTVWLVGDGLYSMGGFADFASIRDFLFRNPNGRVWLDDAHSVGMLGKDGRGEAMEQLSDAEISDRVVVTGSFGKAFGAAGGFAVGSQAFISDMLKTSVADRFSCNIDIAAQGAILASMKLLADPSTLRGLQLELEKRLHCFDSTVIKHGLACEQHASKIAFRLVPFRDAETAISVAGKLLENGFITTPVYFPTIARGAGGIRVSISASHSVDQVRSLALLLVDLTA
jgi:8-amino-7-oxononanoate synthase